MTDSKGVNPHMPPHMPLSGEQSAQEARASEPLPEVLPDDASDVLSGFFAAAQVHPAQPSADFMARMQAQALAAQPVAGLRETARTATLWARVQGLSARAFAALGGLAGVSSLAAATVVGVWFGAAPPEAVSDSVTTLIYGGDSLTLDPIAGFDFAAMEG